MRYRAKQINHSNDWAVFDGKSYFTSTVTADETEARDRAVMMSAHFYQRQIDKCREAMEKSGYFERNNCDFSDVMC